MRLHLVLPHLSDRLSIRRNDRSHQELRHVDYTRLRAPSNTLRKVYTRHAVFQEVVP